MNDARAQSSPTSAWPRDITGTDVAKDAFDMILMDDRFTTIVYAVRGGRRVFRNIQKIGLLPRDRTTWLRSWDTAPRAVALNWNAPLTAVMRSCGEPGEPPHARARAGRGASPAAIMEHPPIAREQSCWTARQAPRYLSGRVHRGARLVAFVIGFQNAGSYELGCTMSVRRAGILPRCCAP